MSPPPLARLLIARLPFYYGWVVLACLCLAGFARQGSAVAVLSIFVVPMGDEFGWSRSALSGAVSLGGLIAALIAPVVGPMVDRHGSRVVILIAVIGIGTATASLSTVGSLATFYLLYCLARMIWAGPFELGFYSALNHWFVAHRAFATAIATLAQLSGLVALPLIAQLAMSAGGWRFGWITIGATVLLVGFLPIFLLHVSRPEEAGLQPDRLATSAEHDGTTLERSFSRAEAVRTRTFWLLSLYTVLVFPVQAGISLHQAPHLIERGIAPITAAAIVSTFSFLSAISSFGVGLLVRRFPVRALLGASALLLFAASLLMANVAAVRDGYLAAALFGLGIGGILTLLPLAWANYFGRESYGAIRGVALSMQVLAQAAGPMLAGILRDWSGNYAFALAVFAVLSALATATAFTVRAPSSET
jgi:OFA family oxalate/formate antiporter-like MFS transporter